MMAKITRKVWSIRCRGEQGDVRGRRVGKLGREEGRGMGKRAGGGREERRRRRREVGKRGRGLREVMVPYLECGDTLSLPKH